MNFRSTYIERAFELAESGKFQNLNSIRNQLKIEGFVDGGQLSGKMIRNQMIKLIAAAKAKPSG